ncbi:uncharacterized protein LOC107805013 [Nicotiana tabacum]|uniref:Uncharacterized protein LOC107805013 n=1 Tax=Nicotiana tabacum TaxID=4097 RepID=A0AC58UMI9_TOBAC
MSEYILFRFHHGGVFIEAPVTKYVGESEVKEFSIDKDHLSFFELEYYTRSMGYISVRGFYVFNSRSEKFVLIENDEQLYNIGCHCKEGVLYLFVCHLIDYPHVEVVPTTLICEPQVVESQSRATLDGDLAGIIAENYAEYSVEAVVNTTIENTQAENGETDLDAAGENTDLNLSDLFSGDSYLDDIPEQDDSELDEKLIAIRNERRMKILEKEKLKKKKKLTPTEEVELGEAEVDIGFDDIERPSKRDKYARKLGGGG